MSATFRLLFAALLLAISQLAMADTVDINSADAQTLAVAISGVGQARAEAIVAYREQHGPFQSVDELMQVSGVGPATLERNRDKLSVGSH